MARDTVTVNQKIHVGDRVKYSTRFIRSIGNVGCWRAEVKGTVIDLVSMSTTSLALVQWDDGNGFSEVNFENVVKISDVYKEARQAENDRIAGLVIGSNAFAEF